MSMYKCPIDYYIDNLVFNMDKSCWAIYRLTGFNYDYLSTTGKVNKLVQLARVYSGIMSYAQILVIPINKDIEEHFKSLKNRLNKNDILYESATKQIDLTQKYLEDKTELAGQVNDYATYFVVKLSEASEYEAIEKITDFLHYVIKDPVNAINVQMNLDTKDILASKIEAYRKMANRWLDENKYKMSMEAVSTEEAQWIIRRIASRGTGTQTQLFYQSMEDRRCVPDADTVMINREQIVRPYHRNTVNLFSGSIENQGRYLKVTTGFTTSYQTFLPIVWLPEQSEFPGKEWLYELQQQNMQAELCIHIKAIPHKSALHQLELKKREIESQIEHVEEASADVPDDLFVSQEYANYMEKELKEDRSPILESSITICLADSDLEKLERKCARVKELYDDMNIIVERPMGDQFKLYMSFIPSVRLPIKDFVLRLTPVTLASGIVGVTRELGDDRGGYIGTTGREGKSVYYAPELACLQNMSPAATFFGDLGTGKSFNANILVYQMVLYGGYALIIDPKGERSHWERDLIILRGLISTVTLGAAAEDRGKLDPYNIYSDNIREAHELTLNVISDLFGLDPKSDEYIAVLEAQKMMQPSPGPNCMLKLSRLLEEIPEDDNLHEPAKKLARRINLYRDNGMAGLLMGDGTESAINLNNRLNIIQLQNLKMPSPETPKQDYSRDEVLSVVIFGVVSAFVRKFALVKRPVPKGVLVDESWAISASKEGRSMEEFISRMGRSLYTCIIYNGHSTKDLPTEGIRNSITYKFVFRSRNNEKESERLLEYLGLEVTPENMSVIQNLGAGQCLFKDLYGRVGVLQFDPVFQDLFDVFSTTPTENVEESLPSVPDAREAAAPVPDAREAAAPVPDAREAAAPVPDAREAAAPVPDVREAAAPVPDAREAAAPVSDAREVIEPIPKMAIMDDLDFDFNDLFEKEII
ncbi:ATP-binding protein [Lachnoclostridium pacaense]|uniref:ATP-binding protein n=1 Tax=Enterocloster hominis (ex Hitch et al. 2024) TaxID=1917870 RepID=UPI001D118A9F|nr:ATP-binding protein [Lachnoclostridium pacaense]MCC2821001.1 ATP-binding protein [Lachnoclostridium pacaense]